MPDFSKLKDDIDKALGTDKTDKAEKKEDVETVKVETKEDVSEQETPEFTEVEKKAMELGWKADYKGDDAVDADEYVKRGSFFKKIATQKREIEDLKVKFKNLASHLTKTEQSAYDRAIKDILKERDEAVDVGDRQAFEAAEQKLTSKQQEMEASKDQFEKPTVQPVEVPEAKEWMEKNKTWFNEDTPENKEMKEAAILVDEFIGKQAKDQGKTLSPAEHLNLVEKRIKQLYPERFENPNREKPAMVGKSTVSKESSKSSLVSKLTPIQRKVAEDLVKTIPGYTLEKYAEQVNSYGELK